jgi:hypothetical protein
METRTRKSIASGKRVTPKRKVQRKKSRKQRGGQIPFYNQDSYGRYRGDYGDSNIVGSYQPELPYQTAVNYLDGKFPIFNETISDPLNHTGAQIGSHASARGITNGLNFNNYSSLDVYNPISKRSTAAPFYSKPSNASFFTYNTSIPGFSGGRRKKRIGRKSRRNRA